MVFDREGIHTAFHEIFGKDHHFVIAGVNGNIIEIRMERDGQIGRNGPGCGGPDDNGNHFSMEDRANLTQVGYHGELNKNGRGCVDFIFHFRFRKGGPAGDAPVDRFFAPVHAPVEGKSPEFPYDRCLISVIHGEIRIVPLSQNTEAFELLSLDVDELLRILSAFLPDLSL
jgi:hypothetical protein